MSKRKTKVEKPAEKPAAKTAQPRRRTRREPLGERLPYPGGFPVYLARYVLFGGERPRAAMRFFNASDVLITGLKFKVTEKDSGDRAIAVYTLERRGLFVESGVEFAVADAPVSKDCASIEVALESVISDLYEYVVEGDAVSVHYGAETPEREFVFKKHAAYKVRKRRKRYVLISFFAVLAVVVVTLALGWRMGAFNDVLPDTIIKFEEAGPTYFIGDDGRC